MILTTKNSFIMANYATLKSAIQDAIKTNGNNEITGALLQQSLLAMINSLGVGYQFMGIATPETNPGTPDQNVFYLAFETGEYTNFGGSVVPSGSVGIFTYNGAWSYNIKSLLGNGRLYRGIALPTTTPSAGDPNVYYFATTPGTYQNFNNIVVESEEIALLYKNGTTWGKTSLFSSTCHYVKSGSYSSGQYVFLYNYFSGKKIRIKTTAGDATKIRLVPLYVDGTADTVVVPNSDYTFTASKDIRALSVSVAATDTYTFEIFGGTSLEIESLKQISLESGLVYMGMATPSTVPTSQKRCFYVATSSGDYSNFRNGVIINPGEMAIFTKAESTWGVSYIFSSNCHYKCSGDFAASSYLFLYRYLYGRKVRIIVNSGVFANLLVTTLFTDGSYNQYSLSGISTEITTTKDIFQISISTKPNGAGTYDVEIFGGISLDLQSIPAASSFTYMGYANPNTSPTTEDKNVFYIATKIGTYPNFGNLTIVTDGAICLFKHRAGVPGWTREFVYASLLKYNKNETISTPSYLFDTYNWSGKKIRVIVNNGDYHNLRIVLVYEDGTFDAQIALTGTNVLYERAKNIIYASIYVNTPGTYDVDILGGDMALSLYDMQAEIDSISAAREKEGEPNTTVHFQTMVNVTMDDFTSETSQLQDSANMMVDQSMIMLPADYSKGGRPVPLVIGCHGAGGGVTSQSSQTENNTFFKYLVANGFAVMDTNGIPEAFTTENGLDWRDNIGSPIAVQCYIRAYQYVIEHFNVKPTDVVICGASMGGISSTNVVLSGAIPICVHTIFCPVLDTYNNIFLHPWYGTTKKTMAVIYGFTSIDNYDESKIRGYNPIVNGMQTFNTNGERVSSVGPFDFTTGQLNGADVLEYKNYPVTVKIWHCTDDPTVNYAGSVRHVNAIRRGGGRAYLRTFTTGGHAPESVGNAIQSPSGNTTYRGETLTIKPAIEEEFLFIKRFAKSLDVLQ